MTSVVNEDVASSQPTYDVIEGANYLLREFAFLMALPYIQDGFEEYTFIYHRDWPISVKFFGGYYDDICRPYFGFAALH